MRANPTTMFFANSAWISKKSPSSTTRRISPTMSYGWLGDSGTYRSSSGSSRSTGSVGVLLGGSSWLFDGRNERSVRIFKRQSASDSATRWATPETDACVSAPPRVSFVTSSCVTVLMTSGPVTNIELVPRTIRMKSVMAGE